MPSPPQPPIAPLTTLPNEPLITVDNSNSAPVLLFDGGTGVFGVFASPETYVWDIPDDWADTHRLYIYVEPVRTCPPTACTELRTGWKASWVCRCNDNASALLNCAG